MPASIQVPVCHPLQNLVTVKADAVKKVEETAGGIALPDIAQTVVIKRTGTVLECGPMVDPEICKPGDRILFGAYQGTTIEVDGQEIEIMNEIAVMARIED